MTVITKNALQLKKYMKYKEDYALTHDIDLFCVINNQRCHFASNGNLFATHFDRKRNQFVKQIMFSEEFELTESKPNVTLVNAIVNRFESLFWSDRTMVVNNYLSTFNMMARLGFFSYDILGEKDGVYYAALIAKPEQIKEGYSLFINKVPHLDDVRIEYIETVEDYRRFRDDNYNDK